jgi:sec-independent protein translocase protein TatC
MTINPLDNGDNNTNDTDKAVGSKEMPIVAHFEELRRTLIRCLCVVVLCAIPCWVFWERIFDFFAVVPLNLSDPTPRLIYTSPTETIMLSFKIALTGGVIFALPFVFWQIWRFAAPGLYKKERILIMLSAFASTLCFLSGFAICYFLLPFMLRFLTGFAAGPIEPLFRIDEYFDFLIKTSLAFGIAFELPVVAFMLSRMGLIDHHFLIRYFRHSIIGIFIVAAILTPPDVLSQVLLALPLLALYALSILIAFLARRRSEE